MAWHSYINMISRTHSNGAYIITVNGDLFHQINSKYQRSSQQVSINCAQAVFKAQNCNTCGLKPHVLKSNTNLSEIYFIRYQSRKHGSTFQFMSLIVIIGQQPQFLIPIANCKMFSQSIVTTCDVLFGFMDVFICQLTN